MNTLSLRRWWLRLRARFICPHRWRPAVLRQNQGRSVCAARYCDLCDKTESMYLGDFYAQFGRMPW